MDINNKNVFDTSAVPMVNDTPTVSQSRVRIGYAKLWNEKKMNSRDSPTSNVEGQGVQMQTTLLFVLMELFHYNNAVN